MHQALTATVCALSLLCGVAPAFAGNPASRAVCIHDGGWGTVAVEGHIVAADVPGSTSARIVFGKAITRAQPAYPDLAKRDEATGTIVIIAKVSPSGDVREAEVRFEGRHPALEQAALGAAKAWRFSPTTAKGEAVAAFAQIVFQFRKNE